MSFFEPPPAPPEPPEQAGPPPWLGPPENELGASTGVRLVLARTDDVAVALVDVVAYSSGLTLRVAVRARRGGADLIEPGAMLARRGRDPSPEALRFGVELADGRRATSLGRLPHGGEDSPEIALVPRSGGGGGRSYDQTYWLWPLPPPGKLTVAVEWPGREIPLTTHELDAAPILEAAARSLPLWEDDGPGPTSGGWARYAP